MRLKKKNLRHYIVLPSLPEGVNSINATVFLAAMAASGANGPLMAAGEL